LATTFPGPPSAFQLPLLTISSVIAPPAAGKNPTSAAAQRTAGTRPAIGLRANVFMGTALKWGADERGAATPQPIAQIVFQSRRETPPKIGL
jgi:hypothetical protein